MGKRLAIIEAMGKNIIIDNPRKIKIVFKDDGLETLKLKMRIDRKNMEDLKRAFRGLGVK